MTTELTTKSAGELTNIDPKQALAMLKTGGFLPRLQLMTSNSNPCKEGTFPTNHYALVEGSDNTDLGSDVDIIVLAMRMKAIDMSSEDDIVTVYDPKVNDDGQPTGLFAEIQARSNESDSGCMWGGEFLVYIPSAAAFATFFMGSKSSRRSMPQIMSKMPGQVTLRAKKIETKKYTWFTPAITACSTPLEAPTEEQATREVTKFLNPPEVEKEESSEAKQAR